MFDSLDFSGPSLKHGPVTLEQARVVAAALLKLPGVIYVEIYVSVSREESGNDLDLILIGDENLYRRFVRIVLSNMKFFEQEKPDVFDRKVGVIEAVGNSAFWEVSENLEMVFCGSGITDLLDIFIMPTDWRNRIGEIQSALPHDDPNFVQNIAQDARQLAAR